MLYISLQTHLSANWKFVPVNFPHLFHSCSISSGLPWWLIGKEFTCKAGEARDAGLIPELERYPRMGIGNPLQYSCLENSMDRWAWWATVHGAANSWSRLSTLAPYSWKELDHPLDRILSFCRFGTNIRVVKWHAQDSQWLNQAWLPGFSLLILCPAQETQLNSFFSLGFKVLKTHSFFLPNTNHHLLPHLLLFPFFPVHCVLEED